MGSKWKQASSGQQKKNDKLKTPKNPLHENNRTLEKFVRVNHCRTLDINQTTNNS